MFAELLSNITALATWKKNPKITKKEMHFLLTKNNYGLRDNPEKDEPFSDDEINRMKEFSRKHNPTAYYELFPEEKNSMSESKISIEEKLKKIEQEYPLVPHTGAGRLFSMVRRMKAEKEMGIPINRRSGFVISTESGKNSNTMTDKEWEKFYEGLCEQLKRDYPELYSKLFTEEKTFGKIKRTMGKIPVVMWVWGLIAIIALSTLFYQMYSMAKVANKSNKYIKECMDKELNGFSQDDQNLILKSYDLDENSEDILREDVRQIRKEYDNKVDECFEKGKEMEK